MSEYTRSMPRYVAHSGKAARKQAWALWLDERHEARVDHEFARLKDPTLPARELKARTTRPADQESYGSRIAERKASRAASQAKFEEKQGKMARDRQETSRAYGNYTSKAYALAEKGKVIKRLMKGLPR